MDGTGTETWDGGTYPVQFADKSDFNWPDETLFGYGPAVRVRTFSFFSLEVSASFYHAKEAACAVSFRSGILGSASKPVAKASSLFRTASGTMWVEHLSPWD